MNEGGGIKRVEYIWEVKGTYNQTLWQGPAIKLFRNLREDENNFKASLGNSVGACLKVSSIKRDEGVAQWLNTWNGWVLKLKPQERGDEVDG